MRSIQAPQVSPWQENGNLLVYVKNNPAANKNDLVSYIQDPHMKMNLMS